MLTRCVEFLEILSEIKDNEIEKLVLTVSECRRIKVLDKKFEKLNNFTLTL